MSRYAIYYPQDKSGYLIRKIDGREIMNTDHSDNTDVT